MKVPEIKISEASGVPFYRQIVDQIGQLIRSGQLMPGEQLPSVRQLAGELLVSLITTRRAYADLESAGLIIRRQGHGTFVAQEIDMASHEQAIETTRVGFDEVVGEARRMGLADIEITALFEGLMTEGGNDNEK